MESLHVDCVIFGGGISGLWLLDVLRHRGYSAVLVEAHALGTGQTVASQGILHSGLKYSLRGILSASAREAREMPVIWRQCLTGNAEPRLTETEIRSENFYLWGTDSASSQLALVGASLGLKVTPRKVDGADRPALLQTCPGSVYRVDEQVISPASLLANFASRNREALLKVDPAAVEFEPSSSGGQTVVLEEQGRKVAITARWIVLTAGTGNERLREQLGLRGRSMQRRPLHMVLVRGRSLPLFYGHCIDGNITRVSITSAVDSTGTVVWQVGGQVAESGVAWSPEEVIRHTQAEFAAVMPELDLSDTQWAAYRVDRAEGATTLGGRPHSFRLLQDGNVLTAWPTKLVLAPQLAEAILKHVTAQAPVPKPNLTALEGMPRPEVASPPWEQVAAWQAASPADAPGRSSIRRPA